MVPDLWPPASDLRQTAHCRLVLPTAQSQPSHRFTADCLLPTDIGDCRLTTAPFCRIFNTLLCNRALDN